MDNSRQQCRDVTRKVVMPYKSVAQERYFNANRAKLESQGVDVNEWNKASKGMKLPKRKKKSKFYMSPRLKHGR